VTHYNGSVPETKRAPDWRDDAACRDEDSEAFFASSSTSEGKRLIQHAKAVCSGCLSRDECGQWALETRQAYGMWGGMTEDERKAVLRRRGIRIKDHAPDEPEATTAEVAALRPKVGRPRAECGTPAAYDRHVRNGEPIDAACRKAHAEKTARYRATGSTKVAV
jgi:WhiB family redox-sensing transcriptional regulator